MKYLIKLNHKEVILSKEQALPIIEFKKNKRGTIKINGTTYKWDDIKIAPVPEEYTGRNSKGIEQMKLLVNKYRNRNT